jgi:hypothetical protein
LFRAREHARRFRRSHFSLAFAFLASLGWRSRPARAAATREPARRPARNT